MRVVTLHPADFAEHCRRLQQLVSEGYSPDLVVGIANGGLEVARLVFGTLPHVAVSCARPTTATKNRSRAVALVSRLPLWMRDALRRIEARWLARSASSGRTPQIADDARRAVEGARHILVVDDAVDSGSTLSAVLNLLHDINPSAHLRAAALTVTTASPLARPDFSIYSNVLIRFPWSLDYTPPRR